MTNRKYTWFIQRQSIQTACLLLLQSKFIPWHWPAEEEQEGEPEIKLGGATTATKTKNLKLIEIPKRFIAAFSLLPGKVKQI